MVLLVNNVNDKCYFLGGGLEALKQKLQLGIQKRRVEAYTRRLQLYKMENEEDYDADIEGTFEQENEEEAEMTEESDTDFTEDEGNDDDDDSAASDKDDEDSSKKGVSKRPCVCVCARAYLCVYKNYKYTSKILKSW